MAQDSWPSPAHNSRAITDAEYEKLAARFSDDGVYGSPVDPQVVTAGTGLTVAIRADVYASVRGHAWSSGTSGDTLSIAPNASSQTRIDRVVLRLTRSTWTVRAVVKQGTPGSGVPALTQQSGDTGVWEVLLANVTVAGGATNVAVTRGERYVGTRIRLTTSTSLTDPNPVLGEVRYETDTKRLQVYDGSAPYTVWEPRRSYSVDSPLSAWSIGTQSVLEYKAGTVHLRLGSFVREAGRLAGADQSRLPVLIPAAYRHPVRDQYVIGYVSGLQICRMTIGSAASDRPGQVWLNQHPDIPTGTSVLSSGISWVVS